MIALAQIGNKITISFGIKKSKDSPLVNSPPIPAVVKISPEVITPIAAYNRSAGPCLYLRHNNPIARPVAVIESNNLFEHAYFHILSFLNLHF